MYLNKKCALYRAKCISCSLTPCLLSFKVYNTPVSQAISMPTESMAVNFFGGHWDAQLLQDEFQ